MTPDFEVLRKERNVQIREWIAKMLAAVKEST